MCDGAVSTLATYLKCDSPTDRRMFCTKLRNAVWFVSGIFRVSSQRDHILLFI